MFLFSYFNFSVLILILFLWLYLQTYVNLGKNCSSPVCVLVLLKIGSMVSKDYMITTFVALSTITKPIKSVTFCTAFILSVLPFHQCCTKTNAWKTTALDIFLRLNCWSVMVTNTAKPACSESVSRIRKASLFWCPAGFTISILSLFQLEFMCVCFFGVF